MFYEYDVLNSPVPFLSENVWIYRWTGEALCISGETWISRFLALGQDNSDEIYNVELKARKQLLVTFRVKFLFCFGFGFTEGLQLAYLA